ncbi:hypothetical protein GCM10010517_09430 [Streptosporangium fragile]|uniref:Terpene synthase n=1 Tax=Streptosporangium fragile TaxID=46186 RepID=A0ABN3VQV8_9ACTN
MLTELHRPPGPLARLTERLAAMAVPCPAHPAAHRIGAAAIEWSRAAGLGADPADSAVHRLAARAFAGGEPGAAEMFARWLTWMSRIREEPGALAGILTVAAGGEPGPAPLERSFAGLWESCVPGMDDAWRERFLAGLAAQHEALTAHEAPAGGVPSPGDCPGRARNAFGRYLFDLVEPCTGVQVPEPLRASPRWRAVVEASGDVAARCLDLATRDGRASAAAGFVERSTAVVTEEAVDRVADRMEELWTAARVIPVLVERHGLGFGPSREVMRVVCAFLTISRAHLEWLLESPRYRHLE